MNGMTGNSPAARARRRLLLLAVIFILPVLIAYALYYSGWRPAASGNYGELVQAPRPLPDLALQTPDGQGFRVGALRGRWTLLAFGAAECRQPCADNLDKMQRVMTAQGKEAARVRAVFVVTDRRALERLRRAIEAYPGTLAIVGPAHAVRTLASHFTLPSGTPPADPNRVYVIDPLGNLMMSYPADADAGRMRKDLARLLRVSQVG